MERSDDQPVHCVDGMPDRLAVACIACWTLALIPLAIGGSIVASWLVVGGYDPEDARLGLSPANLAHAIETGLLTAVISVATLVSCAVAWFRRAPARAGAVALGVVVLRTVFYWAAAV